MKDRKQQEAELHDFLRGKELAEGDSAQLENYTANKKFYAVTRGSEAYCREWLRERIRGKRVLDYACGDGGMSLLAAELGAREVVGIDISPVSIENCKLEAGRRGLNTRCSFQVMDAENMSFQDREFDYIIVDGVLHHLDNALAFPELARVLKSDGEAMCLEALGHNLVFQLYRERTPHLRTKWETKHIVRCSDLELARRSFGQIEIRFFHLATLLAVPFRKTPLFQPLLKALEGVDAVLMRLPIVKWQAWMIWFVLSQPIKPS